MGHLQQAMPPLEKLDSKLWRACKCSKSISVYFSLLYFRAFFDCSRATLSGSLSFTTLGNGKRQGRTFLAEFSFNFFVSNFLLFVKRIIMDCGFKTIYYQLNYGTLFVPSTLKALNSLSGFKYKLQNLYSSKLYKYILI